MCLKYIIEKMNKNQVNRDYSRFYIYSSPIMNIKIMSITLWITVKSKSSNKARVCLILRHTLLAAKNRIFSGFHRTN